MILLGIKLKEEVVYGVYTCAVEDNLVVEVRCKRESTIARHGDNVATLDLVTSMALSATYGIGMVLAAPVLLCWQGAIYALAKLCGNVISPELLCEMSIVGGILIAASGLSILDIKDCKTLNLLPALFVPVLFFVLKSLLQLPI